MSPQRTTAPCARTARWKDDVFGPVYWLRGSRPFLTFPGFVEKAQWHTEEGLTAHSCWRSFGFGRLSRQANRTEFPCRSKRSAAQTPALETKAGLMSRREPTGFASRAAVKA